MRPRSQAKQQSVINATIKVINQQGFSNASIAKIAKEASVSPATIYVYYQDKTDLILSVYYHVKSLYSQALYSGIDHKQSVKENFKTFWNNIFKLSDKFADVIFYTQQLANSPYYQMLDKKILLKNTEPILQLLERGKKEKIIRDISLEVFTAFFFVPANFLSNKNTCPVFQKSQQIDQTFNIAWNNISIQ